jgi:hypothetical protein
MTAMRLAAGGEAKKLPEEVRTLLPDPSGGLEDQRAEVVARATESIVVLTMLLLLGVRVGGGGGTEPCHTEGAGDRNVNR